MTAFSPRRSRAHARHPSLAEHRLAGSRTATHDPRWPAIAAALTRLRDAKRHSVRIVDVDCGAGCLLLQSLRYARLLGFTAIEGRGIDGAPALIGRARAAAGRLRDPAIGVVFEQADLLGALREEHDAPADIVLWRATSLAEASAEVTMALTRAGRTVIGAAPARPLARVA